MSDDEPTTGQVAFREAVVQLIGLAAAAVMIVAMDQRAQITLRAWWVRARSAIVSWNEAEAAGEVAAAWWMREHERKIIGEAERITREEAPGAED